MNRNHLPCLTCLKYPICANKDEVQCDDLIKWLLYFQTTSEDFTNRLGGFEAYWDREVSVITENSLCLYFKNRKDHHSCLISKNS